MMDPNTGEVLAMATNRTYSLQNPWNLDTLRYLSADESAKAIHQAERIELKKYYDTDTIDAMTEEAWNAALSEHYSTGGGSVKQYTEYGTVKSGME